jgi:hypothetical protein
LYLYPGFHAFSGDSRRRISLDFLDVSHVAHVQILSSAPSLNTTKQKAYKTAPQAVYLKCMRSVLTPPITVASLAPLKPIWKVSIQALIRRARELLLVSQRQYYYLSEQIGRMGLRTEEGDAIAVFPEKPRALRQLLEMVYGIPLDVRKIARELHLTPTFVADMIEAHAAGPKPKPKAPSLLSLNKGNRLPPGRR